MTSLNGPDKDNVMKDGILVLNKPADWTSHDCVAICRRVLRLKGVKKIGHGGTLDPMAEGVLPIFIGQATRIMEYLELDSKTYVCTMRLGLVTDTQDIWGTVLEERSTAGITEAEILQAFDGFHGVIEQMPPIYSAVRVDGRHLYDYARKGSKAGKDTKAGKDSLDSGGCGDGRENAPGSGIDPEVLARVKPRRIFLHALDVLDMDLKSGTVRFRAVCSKGTYIRTICHDIGQQLGCGAVMTALTRTAVGSIDLDTVPWVSPEEVKAMQDSGTSTEAQDSLSSRLLPADWPLSRFGEITMPADRAKYFRQGNSIRLYQTKILRMPEVGEDPLTGRIPCNARGRSYDRIYRVYQEETGDFLGTGYRDDEQGILKADKVFMALNEPKQNR